METGLQEQRLISSISGSNNILANGDNARIKAQLSLKQGNIKSEEKDVVSLLMEQCATKDRQLVEKDEQIKKLSDMLAMAQQTIHALINGKTEAKG